MSEGTSASTASLGAGASASGSAPVGPASGPASSSIASVAHDATASPAEPTHTLKIDGQEVSMPLSEIVALAQRAKGSEIRFEQAAQQRQQVEALLSRLPEDPVRALVALTGDKSRAAKQLTASLMRDPEVRAAFESELMSHMQYEALDPAERARVDEDREVRRKAAKADEYEQRERARVMQQEEQRYYRQFSETFPRELEAAGVPSTSATLARLAMHVERALERRENVTVRALAERVREELRGDVGAVLSRLDGDKLVDWTGEAGARLMRAHAAKVAPRAPQPERQPGQGKRAPEPPVVERKRVGTSAFFRRVRGEG